MSDDRPGGIPRRLGQIVVINGAPRSGKSSIAAAIQEEFDGPWINLGVDHYMQMTPKRYLPGIGLRPGGERPDLEATVELFYGGLYESIAAHSRLGLNVVADVGHHDAYSRPYAILSRCARRLRVLPVLFVGLRCPREIINRRRSDTGYRTLETTPGGSADPIELWQRAVHVPGIYDLELDTSVLSARECAEQIRQRLANGPPATAFEALARASQGPEPRGASE